MKKEFIDSEQDLYNKLLQDASNLSGKSTKDIEYAMDVIAYHETMRSMDPTQKQLGKGPGRGLFQYELRDWWSSDGKRSSGAGRKAMNSLYNYLGGNYGTTKKPIAIEPSYLPGFLADHSPRHRKFKTRQPSVDVDASMLSAQQQKILFLADKIQDGSISQLKKKSVTQWWLDHHNKSEGTVTRMKRAASFTKDHISYDIDETIEDGISLMSKFFNYK